MSDLLKSESYKEIITKICTKCGEEKPLGLYGKLAKGKHGRRAQCNECRKMIEKARRQDSKTQKATSTIIHTTTPDLLKSLRECITQLEDNDKVLSKYVIGEDNLPINQLAHEPAGILKSVDHIKELTKKYIIESKATDDNSVRIPKIKESQKNNVVSEVAMALANIANLIVNSADIDVVCYHISNSKDINVANAGYSCLVVINGVQLTPQQKTALVEKFV